MGKHILTTSLEMPDDFAAINYDAVHSLMQPLSQAYPLEFAEYAGGWNAVAYRFAYLADHDDLFRDSLVHNDRHGEEKGLFGFFVAGLSIWEALCYSLHFIGAILEPATFPWKSERDLRTIRPQSTSDRFTSVFPRNHIAAQLASVVGSREFQEWSDIRNVLTHRSAPARVISASISSGFGIPKTVKVREVPDVWKLKDLSIDASLTGDRRHWMSEMLTTVFRATATFITERLARGK